MSGNKIYILISMLLLACGCSTQYFPDVAGKAQNVGKKIASSTESVINAPFMAAKRKEIEVRLISLRAEENQLQRLIAAMGPDGNDGVDNNKRLEELQKKIKELMKEKEKFK